MANRIKITFPSNPSSFYTLSFAVVQTSLAYAYSFSKVFVTGTPTSSNQVKIGATLLATMNNFLSNLITYDLDGNCTYSIDGAGAIYINFNIIDEYDYTIIDETTTPFSVFELQTITVPPNDILDPLNFKDISIRIFDTYTNTRILQNELAAANACKLSWDGGDDLYKSIAASVCDFNMLVADASDAYFLHLFSGDEQRYRVEVVGVDIDLNEQLIWQGYILPDQYNEPYKNGVLFVDFKSTDMISSLKGKYFEPWYYNNRLPIGEVISLALKNTGLLQNLIVTPVLIPESPLFEWHQINVDLRAFLDNGKLKDCYSILESILKSQGLTIYSFRGFWWLEGCSRKSEKIVTALQFDTDGKRIADIDLVKIEVDAFLQADAPNLIAVTPWHSVNMNFKVNGTENLFTERVVVIPKSEQFYSNYQSPGYVGITTPAPEFYCMVKLDKWNENLNGEFKLPSFFISNSLGSENYSLLFWQLVNPFADYNYNEALVLNRWIECTETPYVEPGIMYEFQLQFTIPGLRVYLSENTFKQNLENGYYDRLVPFQIFVDGIEKFSNRPSFVSDVNLRYEIDDSSDGNNLHKLIFKLKFNFNTDTAGPLKFRLLMPINMYSSGGLNNINFLSGFVDILKLSVVDNYDENGDIAAVRDINFTQELDYSLGLSCTIDKSVINSFGLGFPINPNYFITIDRTFGNADITTYHYFAPNVILNLIYNKWDISATEIELLFGKGVVKSVFIENLAGVRVSFTDLWYFLNATNSKIGYLKSYTGFPVIPKKYKAYPSVLSTDILKYMHVKYANENFANRLNWKLVGSSFVDSYPKTLARALHSVQPEMVYRLEAVQFGFLFPNDLLSFYYDNQDRNFIPTRINIDLFNSKSTFTALEAKFIDLENEITYE